MAKSIIDYFKNRDNINMIDKLKELGLNMNYLGQATLEDNNFTGKKFVITGTISGMSRDEIKNQISL